MTRPRRHPRFRSARGPLAAAACLLPLLLGAGGATAQVSVSRTDEPLRFTLSVDKLVYGYADEVVASYRVENVADTAAAFEFCCCGVTFFALRDSACTYDDPLCQIAGCDACETCLDVVSCHEDPCEQLWLNPGEDYTFTWDWLHLQVCPRDVGFDPLLGNVGTFRLVVGYSQCDGTHLGSELTMPIEILRTVATTPVSWGTLKLRSGDASPAGRPDHER